MIQGETLSTIYMSHSGLHSSYKYQKYWLLFLLQHIFSLLVSASVFMVLCCGRTGGVAQVWRGWVFGDWFAGRIKGKSVFTPMQWKNMNQKMPEDWRSRQTIFIAQRFYSSFPPSLFRLILTLQLKNAYPGLRRFLENFLCVRESPGGAWREGRVLFSLSSPLAARSL